jgi:hypothetical protein
VRGLALEPRSSAFRALRDSLQEKARELFLSGYVVRETEPALAVERFRQVLAITSEGDEVHRKAAGWIVRLEGREDPGERRAGAG